MISETLKLFLLLLARRGEDVIHGSVVRYIIKNVLSNAQELPMWKLLSWTYIKNLTIQQFLGLTVIASFTLITFPLGVWINSFPANKYYPLSGIFGHAISLVMIPLNLITYNKLVNEMKFTNTTFLGLVVIEIAMVIGMLGWYLIYKGNL